VVFGSILEIAFRDVAARLQTKLRPAAARELAAGVVGRMGTRRKRSENQPTKNLRKDNSKMNYIILDLDNTIADDAWRIPEINWQKTLGISVESVLRILHCGNSSS
jgi:hypothetical protein